MHVESLSDPLGVELVDFDIGQPWGPEEEAELRRLLCEHHLLAVRDRPVTAADQTRFVASFGPVHTRSDGMKESYVTNVTVDGDPTVRTGTQRLRWHQDGTYGPYPGIAT